MLTKRKTRMAIISKVMRITLSMNDKLDRKNKTYTQVFDLEDVQDIIDDMAGNGYEYRPPLTEDEKFEALRRAAECGEPMNPWKIMDALDDLYLKRQVLTDGEGDAFTEENATA